MEFVGAVCEQHPFVLVTGATSNEALHRRAEVARFFVAAGLVED
jgi:hypothetical protein